MKEIAYAIGVGVLVCLIGRLFLAALGFILGIPIMLTELLPGHPLVWLGGAAVAAIIWGAIDARRAK